MSTDTLSGFFTNSPNEGGGVKIYGGNEARSQQSKPEQVNWEVFELMIN